MISAPTAHDGTEAPTEESAEDLYDVAIVGGGPPGSRPPSGSAATCTAWR
jgi:hypothetical protein